MSKWRDHEAEREALEGMTPLELLAWQLANGDRPLPPGSPLDSFTIVCTGSRRRNARHGAVTLATFRLLQGRVWTFRGRTDGAVAPDRNRMEGEGSRTSYQFRCSVCQCNFQRSKPEFEQMMAGAVAAGHATLDIGVM